MRYALLEELYGKNDIETKKNNYDNIMNDIIKNKNRRFVSNYDRFDNQYLKEEKKYEGFENSKENNYLNYGEDPVDDLLIKNIEKKIAEKKTSKKPTKCEDIIDHCLNCEECKKKLLTYLKNNNSLDKKEEILDIVIYVMTGVFILFLLDFFMKLGKMRK